MLVHKVAKGALLQAGAMQEQVAGPEVRRQFRVAASGRTLVNDSTSFRALRMLRGRRTVPGCFLGNEARV